MYACNSVHVYGKILKMLEGLHCLDYHAWLPIFCVVDLMLAKSMPCMTLLYLA